MGSYRRGSIVEVKAYDQYLIKVHGLGRLTLRNQKFIKKIEPYGSCDIPKSIPWQDGQEVIVAENRLRESENLNIKNQSDNTHLFSQAVQKQDIPLVPPTALEDLTNNEAAEPVEDTIQLPCLSLPDHTPALRRSSRNRAEPDRLNVGTWKGKSYDSKSTVLQEHDPNDSLILRRPNIDLQSYNAWWGRGHLRIS